MLNKGFQVGDIVVDKVPYEKNIFMILEVINIRNVELYHILSPYDLKIHTFFQLPFFKKLC